MRRLGALLLLTTVLLSGCSLRSPPDMAGPALRSAPAELQIDLQRGWRFKIDPSGQADWSAPDQADEAWDTIDAGNFWQEQGYQGYSGTAWYRRWVDVPAGWQGRPAFFAVGGVNDTYQVYVSGQRQGEAGSLAPDQSAILHPTSARVEVAAGRRNLLAVRVTSAHNFGGLARGPVVLTTTPTMPRPLLDQAKERARAEPAGVWPGWMLDRGRAWTVTGLPEGGPQSLIGPDGSWEATSSSPSFTAWVIDRTTGGVVKPADGGVELSLLDGHLPIVGAAWSSGPVRVRSQLWQEPARTAMSATTQWTLRVNNDGPARRLTLAIALRPWQVQPGISQLYDVAVDGAAIRANGALALLCERAPSRVVASAGDDGDVSTLLNTGRAPLARAASDAAGLASIALVYDIDLPERGERMLSCAAPVTADGDRSAVSATELRRAIVRDPGQAAARWRAVLRPGSIQLVDRAVTDAYYASLAYLLLSNDGGTLHPGPLLHDAFWYRDSTIMLSALEANGNQPVATRLLEAFVAFQTADGEFPANVSTHPQVGHRRGAPEWDSQGQGIHALVNHYRYTRDTAWLGRQWGAIDLAAGWLERLIDLDGSGLLPPGLSAEDLGSRELRHFWDDFWAVIGWRDAAFASRELGNPARAASLEARADTLLKAVLAASAPAIAQEGIIPNGPNAPDTPAAARGTSPAVWPGRMLSPDLGRAVFERYFVRFVQPYGGGFRHENNNFWPFGGLEIAHASLLLGLTNQTHTILDWHLAHPTLRGVWAWGDEVSQDGSQLIGGDMPHGWTAAEYVTLVRDLLLYESGDRLHLAAGVRSDWLAEDQTIAVTRLPTHFGQVSYRLHRTGASVSLEVSASAPPPGGYDLTLPFDILSVDGAPASGRQVHLAPQTQRATVRIALN